jgi:hypothetical protein
MVWCYTETCRECYKICYIVLQYCVWVGGKTCYNKYVHGMDNFKEDSGKNSSVCVEDTIPRKSVASYLQA